jgi:hypothetical protein
LNRLIQFFDFGIGTATIVESIGIIGIKIDCLVEVLDRLIQFFDFKICGCAIEEINGTFGIYLDRLVKVLYRASMLIYLEIGKATLADSSFALIWRGNNLVAIPCP